MLESKLFCFFKGFPDGDTAFGRSAITCDTADRHRFFGDVGDAGSVITKVKLPNRLH